MMLGALMILFAYTKNENKETEQVRNTATRNAMFLTVLFIFGGMLYRLAKGDIMSVDTSSFLIFLILNLNLIKLFQWKLVKWNSIKTDILFHKKQAHEKSNHRNSVIADNHTFRFLTD